MITVLTFGFSRHQANAICDIVQPSSAAMGASSRALAIRSWPSALSNILRSHSYPGRLAHVPSGMPSLYFPVNRPLASGLKMVVPRPISR